MSRRYQGGVLGVGFNPLQAPNAPTGVTASAGSASASVSFTAPANVGGSAITSYAVQMTKTSDGSRVGGSGPSSPITVSGLTNGAEYTAQVTALNSYGPSPISASSNAVTPIGIGQAMGGGYFAGFISTTGNGVATHYLIVAPVSSGQSRQQWKTDASDAPGTASFIDGPGNSNSMNSSTYPAARFCKTLTIGGYSDWYMAATNELEVCYFNMKPNTVSNTTGSGYNSNSVPQRLSNYTAGNPAQTSATDFQSGGPQAFSAESYWASTQYSVFNAYSQSFNDGTQGPSYKTGAGNALLVRAVRRIPV